MILSTETPRWCSETVATSRYSKRLSPGRNSFFHLAAHADVRRNMQNPRAVWQNNVDATLNVLTCMRAAHVNNLAFASSGIVYCGKGSKETDPLDADSIYGASKIAGEHLIKAFQLETGMHAWRFRFAGLLGPRYTHAMSRILYTRCSSTPIT